MLETVTIEVNYSPLFHESVSILTLRLHEIINFKTLNFKNLTKILLVLTLFQVYSNDRSLERDNFFFASWEHTAQ